MSNDEQWERVGQAIADRIDQLGLTKAAVQKRANVSDKTLSGYIAGAPVRRVDKKRALALALQWSPDAIDRIYDGAEPEELAIERLPDDSLQSELQLLQAQILDRRAARDAFYDQMAELSEERRRIRVAQDAVVEELAELQQRYTQLVSTARTRFAGDELNGDDTRMVELDRMLQGMTEEQLEALRSQLDKLRAAPDVNQQFALAADTGNEAKPAKRPRSRPSGVPEGQDEP